MDPAHLDDWLLKKVSWMVQETSQYLDTHELLSLCQTVATIRLYQTLKEMGGGGLEGIRQALAEQTAALAGPEANPAAKKKPAK